VYFVQWVFNQFAIYREEVVGDAVRFSLRRFSGRVKWTSLVSERRSSSTVPAEPMAFWGVQCGSAVSADSAAKAAAWSFQQPQGA
jgi:hypothetical protein